MTQGRIVQFPPTGRSAAGVWFGLETFDRQILRHAFARWAPRTGGTRTLDPVTRAAAVAALQTWADENGWTVEA